MLRLLPLFGLLLMHGVRAQQGSPDLNRDPVFRTVLSRYVSYPVEAVRRGVYAKLYAGFAIDSNGHVRNVQVLNPAKVGYGFEEEVIRKIKRLPPLHPRYEGEYAVPIVFAYVDHNEKGKLLCPTGTLVSWRLTNRTLLNEVTILGDSRRYNTGNLKPYSVGQVYETNP